MSKVHLAPGLSVPAAELATKVVAALGMRGSGKSNEMAVIAEQLLGAGIQVIVFDDVGIHFSLRLAPNGKSPSGLNIPVLGGRHGDIPLLPTAGELVAKSLAETGSSAVLDISGFRKGERARFAAAFAETLFRAKQQHAGPCFLILEESQRWVPQVIRFKGEGEERMLGAFMEIAEVGRNYGIGMGLISQRPQKINKEVLNLTELLFAFQTNGVLERKAIAEWVQETGAEGRAEVHNELPSLTTGEALVWSPAWLRLFKRYKLPKKTTYDAGATPLTARAQVKTKPLELGELSAAMAAVTEQAKANDPKALQAEVAKLRRELAVVPGKAAPARVIERVPRSFPRQLDAFQTRAERLAADAGRLQELAEGFVSALKGYRDVLAEEAKGPPNVSARAAMPERPPAHTNGVRKPSAPQGKVESRNLSKAARSQLIALAQSGGTATDKELSALSGYRITSSSFDNGLSELRVAGFLTGPPERRSITDAGRAEAGDVAPPPTGYELLQSWLNGTNAKGKQRLARAERAMLESLFKHGTLSRAELSEKTGYSLSSSSFDNGVSRLRTLALAHGPDGGDLTIAESFQR